MEDPPVDIPAEKLFKTLIIGNSGVGKTATLLKYVSDIFPVKYDTTLGMDFQMKLIARGDKQIRLQIWVSFTLRFGRYIMYLINAKFCRFNVIYFAF